MRYFREGKVKEIADYCETDVVGTYQVWLRYEMFRGALSQNAFEASQRNLADFIAARSTCRCGHAPSAASKGVWARMCSRYCSVIFARSASAPRRRTSNTQALITAVQITGCSGNDGVKHVGTLDFCQDRLHVPDYIVPQPGGIAPTAPADRTDQTVILKTAVKREPLARQW